MPPSHERYSQKVKTMKEGLEKAKELVDTLSNSDKERLIRYLGGKRDYNRNYDSVATKVQNHIEENGYITTKQAFDLGYTSKLLDTTTFYRCIISKLNIEVSKKRMSGSGSGGRIAFYDINKGAPAEFTIVDIRLAKAITSNIDLTAKRNDLMPLLDMDKYRVLSEKGSLRKLRPLLIGVMSEKGYEVIGSELEFVRGA
jgi:hypothetical protein